MRTTILFGLFAFLLLLAASAPGLGTEDAAELSAGARLLAMVHPPGYPLYLVAGRLFSALSPVPGRGLVMFSILCGALAVAVVHAGVKRSDGEGAAAIAAGTLLFGQGFWDASTRVEVYSLTTALLASLIAALVALEASPSSGRARRAVAFLVGLTLAHHVGLLILLPLILPFVAWVTRREPPALWVRPAAYLLAGPLLYLALPILSSRENLPVIWWPGIEDARALLRVVSGGPFKKLLFAVPFDEAVRNLWLLPLKLAFGFPLVGVILAAAGLFALARARLARSLLFSGIIAVTVFHAANYRVLDPEVFLMPALVPVAWLAGAGYRLLRESARLTLQADRALSLAFLFVAAAGRLLAGGMMAAAYDSLPLDVSRAVLARHDADRERNLVWADWRFYPALKYFQLVEGTGTNVDVELDTTYETPGPTWREGRTWCMAPSRDLGRDHSLVMEALHWRVGPALDPETSGDTLAPGGEPLLSLGGIEVLRVDSPARFDVGVPIPLSVVFRRGTGTAADTVLGEIVLMMDTLPLLSTPFAPLHWNLPPPRMKPGRVYAEPVQTIIPSAYAARAGASRFELVLRLQTSDSSAWRIFR